jgi:predicted dehydrogenase
MNGEALYSFAEEQLVEPVRLAIVGAGYWGPNLLRVATELPQAHVEFVCDVRPDALQAVARRYPAPRLTTEFDDVIAAEDVDAVVIATPPSTHRTLCLAALEAGKHVLVEKPLATSVRDAQTLVAAAERTGVLLMPGHTFLYSPSVNVVRDLIQAGELGDLYFISMSRVNLGLHQADVSVAWDLGPHDFSILRYWLDEVPSMVSAFSRSCVTDVADVMFVSLEFPSGTIAHAELSWLAPSKLRRTTVVGSEKMVVYDDTSNEPVRIFDSGVVLANPSTFGEYQLAYRAGDVVSPRVAVTEPLMLELADFCLSITRGSKPRSSIEVGLDVVRMCDAADRSARARRPRRPEPLDARATT